MLLEETEKLLRDLFFLLFRQRGSVDVDNVKTAKEDAKELIKAKTTAMAATMPPSKNIVQLG